MTTFQVTAEPTPNPQSMRFSINQKISNENAHFLNSEESFRSPLAIKIFGFPWASGVSIGSDFVTITKQDWVDWEVLSEPLCGLIQEHLQNGEVILHDLSSDGSFENDQNSNDSPMIRKIKQILDLEIRPQVALDGGDVTFHKLEDGIVYLYMHGACSGCPSSTYTLKMGIETRLKEAIPEVTEVRSM